MKKQLEEFLEKTKQDVEKMKIGDEITIGPCQTLKKSDLELVRLYLFKTLEKAKATKKDKRVLKVDFADDEHQKILIKCLLSDDL